MNDFKEKDIIEILVGMFSSIVGNSDVEVNALPASGSDRRYFRLSGKDATAIGTYTPDKEEGRCFVRLTEAFGSEGRSVPRILAVSSDFRFYLQEDLGDRSLFSMLDSAEGKTMVKNALRALVDLQKTPENAWEKLCMCHPFSRRQVMWDLNYFKYEFLKLRNVVFDEELLEDDFESLAGRLLSIPEDFFGFMMRDCQSRNIMVSGRGAVFIDYQGGRKGPSLYDAVSFLWQARAGFSPEFRQEMLYFYADLYCGGEKEKKNMMLSSLDDIVLFRTLQVLGAYGFRGLVQHKAHFVMSIPGALSNLRELLEKGALHAYPELKKAAELLVDDISLGKIGSSSRGLRIEVFSFSYKKGYPEDISGNGGGFMFDCRALHNPGRYREFKHLTGVDSSVVEFLESRGEVSSFLRNAWSLTDAAVERYLSRGFTNLQIGFGCTGGQHRSVYCAHQTALHIEKVFPEAEVVVVHREHPEIKSKN